MNTKAAQHIGLTAWGLLALLQIIWHAWLFPSQDAPLAASLTLALLPLALPLLYWRTPRRALLLAGMIGLFYFCHGVVEAWTATRERTLAWIEILLVVVLVLSQLRKPKKRRAARE